MGQEPCGTPDRISCHVLNTSLPLVLCFLFERQPRANPRDLLPNS